MAQRHDNWISHNDGVITLHQPQLGKLDGNTLSGRAAASFLANGKPEDDRVFGALWFTAKLDIDRENAERRLADARERRVAGSSSGETS